MGKIKKGCNPERASRSSTRTGIYAPVSFRCRKRLSGSRKTLSVGGEWLTANIVAPCYHAGT